MKATEAKLLDFIKKSPQFVIPIYQRTYSWTEAQCLQLWNDIMRTGADDSIKAHFVGSIVYIEEGLYQVTSQSPLLVIDGQQRLTTISLLLAALANAIKSLPEGQAELVDGFSYRKLRNYYLLNPEEAGERYYKLILSQTDKNSLIAIVDDKDVPHNYSIRIQDNYALFESLIKKPETDLTTLCKGIAKLMVVDIALSRDQDNPQLIFESMNSTGLELAQADLIRNFVLMGLPPHQQTLLYNDYWRPMEVDFGQEAYSTYFDNFMRNYLTIMTGAIPRENEVYTAFKKYARPKIEAGAVESLVKQVRIFARYFCSIALAGHEQDKALSEAFHDIRELTVNVAYPFLLKVYHDYAQEQLNKDDFLEIVRLVESYVFRRAICAIPTNSLNKTFATMIKHIDEHDYLASVKAYLLSLPSYRRFPNDEEFKQEFQTRDLYTFPKRSYWLRRLENEGRKERVSVEEYTIEHIMPQTKNLSSAWLDALGPNWEDVHNQWLHTAGNLTLTAYNSEYGSSPFLSKRDMPGGFRESPLRLNKGIGNLEVWNEQSIKERAERLSERAVKVWSIPALHQTIDFTTQSKQLSGYTIQDHPYLMSEQRDLFEAFRREVLALDPETITEEFWKLYVAYKAETNFVDVVPQAKRLRLFLNMPFSRIHDPRGVCTDVTHVGRWGNGDVELGLSSLAELPYVIGLVRQSLEYQMGSDE